MTIWAPEIRLLLASGSNSVVVALIGVGGSFWV
jgi:hypothetical protein